MTCWKTCQLDSTSNHRENNQVILSDHQVSADYPLPIAVQQTSSDKSDIQNDMLENLSTRTSNHRENNQVIPSDHQVNTDALPSISVKSSDKSDIQNDVLENQSTGTSHKRENNQNIRDTLPSSFTHRHSVIDSEANRKNSEKQQNTASDHLKHIDKMIEQNDFPKTKTSNVRQLIHSKFIRPRKLSNGVLTRRTDKEPIKTAVQNLETQLITKVDDRKLNQQDTKQKTIFNHRHFDTSIKKQSVQSPLNTDYTKTYGIEAKSKISNPAYMNVMKAGLQKKEVYKGALDIQAENDNSDYYYDDEDDYDTTDVPGLKFTTKESYENLRTPLKSIKNGEADINENEEYYEYDSYSDSFEDEDVLPEAKRKGIEQSRHTNELKFANPISNSNSKHSQKPPLNSQIDGDFSDYSESDYYSDSYYDDSDDSDVVTANNKDQSNDRNVNPQLSKTVSNVDSDLYYDDSSLPEDNTKYEYYDGSDSDMYYDESESDLSDKRQISTTGLQKPKTNTVPESEISKTIPSNLAQAYERIRKLCLCNYVNSRTPNGVLMQRNT
ncbi:unnamed protein product [Mytilus edulis]|uniref:Uncharacterized protein n=1 Tax=Mytilus edulis TaxID=6550 RepID=A0A8S3TCP9_MYTED|nr:unnamed protein product [Mytilus edulis]